MPLILLVWAWLMTPELGIINPAKLTLSVISLEVSKVHAQQTMCVPDMQVFTPDE